MLDCLQVRPGSLDPQRAHAAGLLRSQRLGLSGDGIASVNGIEVLVTLSSAKRCSTASRRNGCRQSQRHGPDPTG
jgi:hypothetical protein